MKSTTLHLHTKLQIGAVDPRIFGGFLEHIGRAVYEGVYEPQSPRADADGWRSDVLDALRPLDMTVMRYPGGNFASGYHWQDGVGPREQRPRLRELAWNSIEPNEVGTEEFIALATRMGWQPMLAVNLGTGTPEEARNWVEYCNAPAGTRYADMRAANGSTEPHAVKLWCLGNEMDGPWQLGHVPADEYARRAQQAAKMMRDVDRSLEFVVAGSSGPQMDTYMTWDRAALEYVGDYADYISMHRYVGNETDTMDYLAVTNSIDQQIEEIDAVCRYVQGKRRAHKRPYLCFDEWNVWYKARTPDDMNGAGKVAPHLVEEVYNLEDALVVAGFLQSFVRHADVLKIANIAQIVNVIAPILTTRDNVLLQSIYWPFAMMTKRRDGIALRVGIDGPGYESQSYGTTAHIDASAILDGQRLHVFLANRDDAEADVTLALGDHDLAGLVDAEILRGPEPKAANSWEQPDLIRAAPFEEISVSGRTATLRLPPFAFVAATLRLG